MLQFHVITVVIRCSAVRPLIGRASVIVAKTCEAVKVNHVPRRLLALFLILPRMLGILPLVSTTTTCLLPPTGASAEQRVQGDVGDIVCAVLAPCL